MTSIARWPSCLTGLCASAELLGIQAAAEKEKLRAGYTQRGVALLKRAQGAGYFQAAESLEHLLKDRELDPIRSVNEFKELLANLGKTNPADKVDSKENP
jgi:hypothetical protein